MPYPQRLVDAVRDELGLDGSRRLLDLGCGPGSLTHLLAPLVAEAVGVDASAAMLREAERDAAPNERFVCARAEALPGLGTFGVVTLAQSFHWMDQPRVARSLYDLLEPGGALVHVGATTHEGDGDVPRTAIGELIRSYLGERPPPTRSDERRNLGAVGFDGPVEIDVPRDEVFERTPDDVVASVFSLSYASPALFGDRLADFERDLRSLLGGRTYHERPRGITLLVYRR